MASGNDLHENKEGPIRRMERKLQFDAKEPFGFDKTKVECYNSHKTGICKRVVEQRKKQEEGRWNPEIKMEQNLEEDKSLKHSDSLIGESVDWEQVLLADFKDFNGGPVSFGGIKAILLTSKARKGSKWRSLSSRKILNKKLRTWLPEGALKLALVQPVLLRDYSFPDTTIQEDDSENTSTKWIFMKILLKGSKAKEKPIIRTSSLFYLLVFYLNMKPRRFQKLLKMKAVDAMQEDCLSVFEIQKVRILCRFALWKKAISTKCCSRNRRMKEEWLEAIRSFSICLVYGLIDYHDDWKSAFSMAILMKSGSSVDERGKTHHGKSNLFQETPKPLCSTFLPTDVKHCLNVGYTFVNFTTSEAVWKSHVCITRKSWPLFKSKKIAQVVRARIQGKNSLVKHFEDMRLCRPSKEYLQVWFDPPRDGSMSCLTTKGMRTIGAVCARSPKPIKNPSQCTLTRAISLTDILTLQALISLTDFPLLNNMLLLSPVLSTTMIRILWKRLNECLSFHEVIDFLRRSYIYHALTVSPVVSTTFVEQFWTSAKYNSSSKEIKLLKAKITKLKKQAKPVIKHHKAYLKSLSLQQRFPRKSFSKKHRVHKESVSKQGRKKAKGESSVQRNPLLSTEEGVSTDFEKVSTDRPIVSTDGSKEGTEEQREATLLINMSQAKAASKEKEKGVELKDVEEIDRPSLLLQDHFSH
ncbi:putative mei2-like protein [Tanacetum coccineum]